MGRSDRSSSKTATTFCYPKTSLISSMLLSSSSMMGGGITDRLTLLNRVWVELREIRWTLLIDPMLKWCML